MDKNIPKHIAIIMDGNRRWARNKMLPVQAGHKAGAETLQKIIEDCLDIGVEHLTVYAFSTENWKRSEEEVAALMGLLKEYLNKIEKDIVFMISNQCSFMVKSSISHLMWSFEQF